MNCPGCGRPMTALTFDGHLGRSVGVDFCSACQLFWFDRGESLQLAPRSTLQLFRIIGEQTADRRAVISNGPSCPRCGSRLVATHDRQRNTPFQYWRCPRQHGRLITFFDFLREKDFIRPLTPEQIEELRRNLQSVNCSNCGATIDLASASACGHCGSPLSMLDARQARELVAQLQNADRSARPVDPTLPLQLAQARREVESAFAAIERPDWSVEVSSLGLVRAGIVTLLRWLGKARD